MCAIPGGFSFCDYLRTGAIASKSPIINSIIKFANSGRFVLGICNGFQILCETGLLPGVLLRNISTKFVCKIKYSKFAIQIHFFQNYITKMKRLTFHSTSRWKLFVNNETKKMIYDNNQIAFKYYENNPNGSVDNIAGIILKIIEY